MVCNGNHWLRYSKYVLGSISDESLSLLLLLLKQQISRNTKLQHYLIEFCICNQFENDLRLTADKATGKHISWSRVSRGVTNATIFFQQ
mmetsp:Transcript_574/g.1221  ORF Transcript_574/g.1221 Transcript_574/m.1221 type:complete len:89 (-) Transcript_574:1226-1492(-)